MKVPASWAGVLSATKIAPADEFPKVVAKKTTGLAAVTVDGVDVANGSLAVHTLRELGATAPTTGIQSSFPLHDLSQINTEGRYAQGFRLDSGSLRMMWMSVRRTQEADGTPSFEIRFQAHGAAIDRYKKRMEAAGAKSSTPSYFAAEPDPNSPADKSILKQTGNKWSPSGSSLSLDNPGKWSVELVPQTPEAIKGAMTIRVKGSDADATKALNEVVTKLGLQSAFGPPDPTSLERFKLLRFLWQLAPEALPALKLRRREELGANKELASAAKELDPSAAKSAEKPKLSDPAVAERLKLAALLYDKSPDAFVAWAKSDQRSTNGILPTPGSPNPRLSLDSALASAGISKDAIASALAAPLDAASARGLLLLGAVARKDTTRATALTRQDTESIPVAQIHDACVERGFSEERLAQLRFDEVYPGYFTVVDPSLSRELFDHGARWLYSTSDNPERVWQMLTGGQKASLTRFEEGILIQGKSSSSDFGTGGAASVFTRLVTESAIEKYAGGNSSYDTGWYDWSGSRPYKLMLNRSLLDRTDWYGFNGDNFGKTTDLKPDNHGSKLVDVINANFSTSNELCFPIGNAPAYVDYVACANESQRTALIDELKKRGMTGWHGKTLEEFVVVMPRLADHPDDVTLQTAVRDELKKEPFSEAITLAEAAAKQQVESNLAGPVKVEAKSIALEQGPAVLAKRLEAAMLDSASSLAKEKLLATPGIDASLDLEAVKPSLVEPAKASAREAVATLLRDLGTYSELPVENAVNNAVLWTVLGTQESIAQSIVEKLKAELGAPADASEATRAALRAQLSAALKGGVREAIEALVAKEGAGVAKEAAEAEVASTGATSTAAAAQDAAEKGAADVALGKIAPGALEALITGLTPQVVSALFPLAAQRMGSDARQWIAAELRPALEALAMEGTTTAAIGAVHASGKDKALALAKVARDAFAQKSPAKVTPEEDAKVEETVLALLARRAAPKAEAAAKSAIGGGLGAIVDEASTEAAALLGAKVSEDVVDALALSAAKKAVESKAREIGASFRELGLEVAAELSSSMKAEIGAELAALVLRRYAEQVGNMAADAMEKKFLESTLAELMAKAPAAG